MASVPQDKPVEVFYSYSHEDEDLRVKLERHLSILRNQGLITEWHDRNISAGTEWEKAIDDHLNSAEVILLLISSDFLASKYCYSIEMTRALVRHDANEARVIPIILRAVSWRIAPFSKLNALPRDGKAITSWSNHDEAFTNVAEGIQAVVRELRGGDVVAHWVEAPAISVMDVQKPPRFSFALAFSKLRINITVLSAVFVSILFWQLVSNNRSVADRAILRGNINTNGGGSSPIIPTAQIYIHTESHFVDPEDPAPGETVYIPLMIRNLDRVPRAFYLHLETSGGLYSEIYEDTNRDSRHQAKEPLVRERTPSLEPTGGEYWVVLSLDIPMHEVNDWYTYRVIVESGEENDRVEYNGEVRIKGNHPRW
jgi:hypothetical protein